MNGTLRHRFAITPAPDPGTVWVSAEGFETAQDAEDHVFASRTTLLIPESEIPALIEHLSSYLDETYGSDPLS